MTIETKGFPPLWMGPSESGRTMYPWEFSEILRTYRHPRWWSMWAYSDRWGKKFRAAGGNYADLATVFAAGAQGEYEDVAVIPHNEIPFLTFRDLIPTADGQDQIIGSGSAQSWRAILRGLVKNGHLRADPHMSFLCGFDSYAEAGRWRVP